MIAPGRIKKMDERLTATAIIYARFSPRRNAEESLSIEVQEGRCRSYCDAKGMVVTDVFKDEAISGARADNRPGFQAAIEKACETKSVLVVYSLSRFARSVLDALTYATRLDEAGANLVSTKESIDTTSPLGRFIFGIFAGLAELERNQVSERTRDAMRHHQANGRLMGSQPPYGWKVDPANPALIIEDQYEQQGINLIVRCKTEG